MANKSNQPAAKDEDIIDSAPEAPAGKPNAAPVETKTDIELKPGQVLIAAIDDKEATNAFIVAAADWDSTYNVKGKTEGKFRIVSEKKS